MGETQKEEKAMTKKPELTPEPQAVVKHESRLAEIDDLLNCPQIAPPSTGALLSACVYLRRKLKEARANHCETCQKYRQALETILQWPYEDHAVIARNALKTSAEPQAGSEPRPWCQKCGLEYDKCLCKAAKSAFEELVAEAAPAEPFSRCPGCVHFGCIGPIAGCGCKCHAPAEPPAPLRATYTGRTNCKNCGNRIYVEANLKGMEAHWRHHGSNFVECFGGLQTGAEPEPPRGALDSALLLERVSQITAHRVCCGTEHDPLNGKLHGYCVVCGVLWPCEYAGKPPSPALGVLPSAEKYSRLIAAINYMMEMRDCGHTHHSAKFDEICARCRVDAALASLSQKEGKND